MVVIPVMDGPSVVIRHQRSLYGTSMLVRRRPPHQLGQLRGSQVTFESWL